MDKRFLSILAALVIIFGGIFFFSQKSSDEGSGGKPTSHVSGKSSSKVKLVEYGDFQCSVCEAYEPVVQQVKKAYAKKIQFQFRNLPLVSLHPNAFSAARAAEAAGLQKKYWQMHDALYQPDNWQVWTNAANPTTLYEDYAKGIGLKLDKFKQDYSSEAVNDAINADLAAFKETGRDLSTPSFFLNGEPVENSSLTDPSTGQPSFKKFKALIDAALAKAKQR